MTIDEKLDDMKEFLGWNNSPTVKSICEGFSDSSDPIDIIQDSCFRIFDFDFPIFDENHRQELETKILKNYYFRRICCESVGEWKLRLSNKLNLIMPYYNEIMYSSGFLDNFMNDVDYSRTISEDTRKNGIENTTSKQEQESTGKSSSIDSDVNRTSTTGKDTDRLSATPQGSLQSIENNTYLTSANIKDTIGSTENVGSSTRNNNSESKGLSNGSFNTVNTDTGKRDLVENIRGRKGYRTKAQMVMEYRKAIVNVDNEIVNRLSDLFMNVYSVWEE